MVAFQLTLIICRNAYKYCQRILWTKTTSPICRKTGGVPPGVARLPRWDARGFRRVQSIRPSVTRRITISLGKMVGLLTPFKLFKLLVDKAPLNPLEPGNRNASGAAVYSCFSPPSGIATRPTRALVGPSTGWNAAVTLSRLPSRLEPSRPTIPSCQRTRI